MLVVKQCVFNQSNDYWLLSNALIFVFSLNIAMKTKVHLIQVDNPIFVQGDCIQIKDVEPSGYHRSPFPCFCYYPYSY
jgi:hypothetical protein